MEPVKPSSNENFPCYYCHSTVVTNVGPSSTPSIAAPALHVNGAEDVHFGDGTLTFRSAVISGTWDGASCAVSCHNGQSRTW